jgi:23S rRNA (pseudouridine1915-N3)-methyltransferase
LKIRVVWVGKNRDPWVKEVVAEYAGRIRRYAPLELSEARDE